jgi:phosphoglycolate phosphatase
MAYEIILFDVDGTLCDPGPSMIESAKYALSKFGIEENDPEALRRMIGPPLEHAFRDNYRFDEEKTSQAVVYFRDKMQKDGVQLYEAYPGIVELVKKLHGDGKKLGVVTSKIDYIAKATLEKTGLLPYFDVVSAQQPEVVVDKEVILTKALQGLGVDGDSSVVMIGDRKYDIEAANTHHYDSIGVTWGYGTRDELEAEGATYVVDTMEQLIKILGE